MYQQIKELAEKALEVQNKDLMDATLRHIVALCETSEPLKSTELNEAALEEAADRMRKLQDTGHSVLATSKVATVNAAKKGSKK
jgi:hypothetical protein